MSHASSVGNHAGEQVAGLRLLGPGSSDLLSLVARLAEAVSDADQVPRRLVGKVFAVFTAMLTEAEHAAAPEPVLGAAWEWQERLRQAFGQTF